MWSHNFVQPWRAMVIVQFTSCDVRVVTMVDLIPKQKHRPRGMLAHGASLSDATPANVVGLFVPSVQI